MATPKKKTVMKECERDSDREEEAAIFINDVEIKDLTEEEERHFCLFLELILFPHQGISITNCLFRRRIWRFNKTVNR